MLHFSSSETRSLIKEGILFLAQMGVLAGVLFVILQPFEMGLQELVSSHAQWILHALGTSTISETNVRFWAESALIEISPLCAGLLEMILLASAIAATNTASLSKKIKGILVGVTLLYLFNVFRIIITVQQLVYTPLSFAEFTHDVFFRVVLIAGFAAIYSAWLNSQKIRVWV